MGRLVVGADVRLDLDDPANAAVVALLPDQTGAEEGTRSDERVLCEQAPIEA